MYRFRTLLKKAEGFQIVIACPLSTIQFVCVKLLDAFPIPRKWLKEAALSDVDLIRQPFEKVLAEGPSFVGRFCFLTFRWRNKDASPDKESIFIECMCPAVQRILSTTITSFCFADFPYTYYALLTFLGLCLHPGKSSTNKDSNQFRSLLL